VRIERLTPNHNVSGFECGVKELNDWLSIHSQENQRRNISRTFVVVEDADEVVGYYSLSMGGVQAIDLPPKLRGGLPRYDIGMVLLGRLALARPLHGRGLGRDLMIDAIVRAATAGKSAAARFIAVDPIDESARKFYVKFGFQEIVGDERGRMYLRIDEALLALGLSEDIEADT
jgi:GNAT superfamily N-acetyltransferase